MHREDIGHLRLKFKIISLKPIPGNKNKSYRLFDWVAKYAYLLL